jgi:surfeit locus 1 family protein
MKPRIWPILLASGIGLAILLALGVWQVQRLAWKNALIAAVEVSMSAAPKEITDNSISEYGKVKLPGKYVGRERLVLLTSYGGAPAWTVVRPFKTTNGDIYIVECGKSLNQQFMPLETTSEVTIEGIVHFYQGSGVFDVVHKAGQKEWYWWDNVGMRAALGAGEYKLRIALLPKQAGTEGLFVDPPKANLRNNHLGYAITWFGLAAALLVMTGVFVMRIVRTR